MVFLLGKHFPDTQLVTKTLTSLYGISSTSSVLRTRAPAAVPYALLHPAAAQAPHSPAPATSPLHAAPLSPKRHSLLARLLATHHIHPRARLAELAEPTLNALAASLDELTAQNAIENNRRRKVRDDIRRLRDMQSYRGRRHALGLPVRGQKSKGQIVTAKKLNRVERRG